MFSKFQLDGGGTEFEKILATGSILIAFTLFSILVAIFCCGPRNDRVQQFNQSSPKLPVGANWKSFRFIDEDSRTV